MHSISALANTSPSTENAHFKYGNSGDTNKKNYLTSSLTRVNNLSQILPPVARTPSKSAFESDPDLLSYKRNNSATNLYKKNEESYKNNNFYAYSYKSSDKNSGN